MLAAPQFTCGAECGVAIVGATSVGTEHWSSVTGGVSAVTTGPGPGMISGRCFQITPAGAAANLTHTYVSVIANPATITACFDVCFTTLPTTNNAVIWQAQGGATGFGSVVFATADNSLRGRAFATTAGSGVVITTGVWYTVDVKAAFLSNAWTVDIQVGPRGGLMVAGAQAQSVTVGSQSAHFKVGDPAAVSAADYFIDNLSVSSSGSDYPISQLGLRTVSGLWPRADGTHGGTWAAGVFKKGAAAGTNASRTDTDIWSSLKTVPLSGTAATNFVGDITGTVLTDYVEFLVDALPAYAGSINAVMVAMSCHAATTTASQFNFQVADGSNAVTLAAGSFNQTTPNIHIAARSTDASGNAWTVATVNALKSRFASTDSNPDVFLDGFVWEVDWVPMSVSPQPQKVLQVIIRSLVR